MLWVWVAFIAMVIVLLALDLGVFNRKAESVSVRKAMLFTAVTVVLALLFAGFVYWLYEDRRYVPEVHHKTGANATVKYLTAWLIEYALSMDNILVIALIFKYFFIPAKYQHRVLFWGIVGALVMRGAMIGVGSALLSSFGWVRYLFGAILFFTAIKLLLAKEDGLDPEQTLAAKIGRKLFPISPELDGQRFFTRVNGVLMATPLFLVLLVIEGTDVIFAVDSIPAAFAITPDPFLVFTSNIFAILGLRSMYFALAAVIDKFRYLKTALIFVLLFISVKMVVKPHTMPGAPPEPHAWWQYDIEPVWSLGIVVAMLGVGVAASWIFPAKKSAEPEPVEMPEVVGESEYATTIVTIPQPSAPRTPGKAAEAGTGSGQRSGAADVPPASGMMPG
ncbi:MAG: TerC family protein [Phycisphaerales bacterium]|nr:TerC family protein [Phycisphaerales bacterium]